MYKDFVDFVREIYKNNSGYIPLHAPVFFGNEKKYLLDTIDSTFVSSVGQYVNKFEEMLASLTGAKYAVATVNGTLALHLGLLLLGVSRNEEVLTQSLTFVATANAIRYVNAEPVFIDVDKDTMGLSPESLKRFLDENAIVKEGKCYNKNSGKRISACIPMHTFGFPCRIDAIVNICTEYFIPVLEDSAESIGSLYNKKHTGTFGEIGIFSFNGNKTVTCGGGGALVTDNKEFALRAKHLSTTAKVPHAWNFFHDEIGYNYRMPNLNAALACAQLESLNFILNKKRSLALEYENFFKKSNIQFITENSDSTANYWLNTIILKDRNERDQFLKYTNEANVMTRPAWKLMNELPMFQNNFVFESENSKWLEDRIVNIPSSILV
jgi:aminotransferase in exopolysaccharide biosynthesis